MSQQTTNPRFKRLSASAMTLALLSGCLLATAAFAVPPEAMHSETMDHSKMAGMAMMPHSEAEHAAMADSYKAKAAGYREDAEMHRKMLADYKASAASNPKSGENPWVTKMRLHCGKYIKDANRLAIDADQFAQFHTMQAKEMHSH